MESTGYLSGIALILFGMVDPRIMAAALASMLLTATGLETGIGTDEISNQFPDSIDLQQGLGLGTSNADKAGSYTVGARLSINRTSSQSLRLESTEVRFGDPRLSMTSGNLTSASPVDLKNFSGKISLDPPLSASGTLQGWNTSSTDFMGSMRLERVTGTDTLSVEIRSRQDIDLEAVKGTIRANGTETRLDREGKLEIKDFKGNISFGAQNSNMIINGSAMRLESGSLRYG
jgi:hypothetical protein